MWKMGSLRYKFGYIGTCEPKEKKLYFVFYWYGLDKDDDNLKKTYSLNYLYIFCPYLDGDIIVKKGWTKQIDPFIDTY